MKLRVFIALLVLRKPLKTAQLKSKSAHYQGFARLKIIEMEFLEVPLVYGILKRLTTIRNMPIPTSIPKIICITFSLLPMKNRPKAVEFIYVMRIRHSEHVDSRKLLKF